VAIGSDNISDSSPLEAEHLHSLGVIDTLALLKLWAEDTPRTISSQRQIGFLREGYEASFLALAGNPLDDWRNIRRITLRFEQGVEVHPSLHRCTDPRHRSGTQLARPAGRSRSRWILPSNHPGISDGDLRLSEVGQLTLTGRI
jgi:hypothetical protein